MQNNAISVKHVLMIVYEYIIRPWQHVVCSPVGAPAEVYTSSFHSQFPATNLSPNLGSIKYKTHKQYDTTLCSKNVIFPDPHIYNTSVWIGV